MSKALKIHGKLCSVFQGHLVLLLQVRNQRNIIHAGAFFRTYSQEISNPSWKIQNQLIEELIPRVSTRKQDWKTLLAGMLRFWLITLPFHGSAS